MGQVQKHQVKFQTKCEKVHSGNGICRVCPPLSVFPLHLKQEAKREPVTPQMVSDCVKEVMLLISVDPKRTAASRGDALHVAMRADSAAGVKAGIPEEVFFLQFGHG
jgi:hypothetical protein